MDNLKKILENKLLRTLLIAIIAIIIVIIIILFLVSNVASTINENNLTEAAKKYYAKYNNYLPKENYNTVTVNLNTLISEGYLKRDMKGAECPSYVSVTNMNGNYEYTPSIMCEENQNETLVSKISSSIVASGDGLYNVNGKYIFRGENPNNYIQFAGELWRIIGLDEFNNIKIIKIKSEHNLWDDRYNSEYDEKFGINDFEVSRLKDYLDTYFEKNNKIYGAKQISKITKHSVCIGKASLENGSYNICDNVLDNQLLSIITIDDYINSSLDASCSHENSINCQNYNYLNLSGWTITADENESYMVYYIDSDEGINKGRAYVLKAIRPVVTLNNNIIYLSGNGTKENPYLIR